MFQLNVSTIQKYLKIGTELMLCHYDPVEETLKAKEKCSRRVVIIKDGKIVGIFDSASDLSRVSENAYGVKLHVCGILLACHGKSKQYKGFSFSFADDVKVKLDDIDVA